MYSYSAVIILLLICNQCYITSTQQKQIDQDTLVDIFGTPPSPTQETTIQPIPTSGAGVTTQQCKCVPYYLCNANNNEIFEDPTITGFGELDIRFAEDTCQESTEKCCNTPVDAASVPVPKPNTSRLKGCGYRNPSGLDFTVTGGTGMEAQFGEFPWTVAILNRQNDSSVCVGSLIHPSVVITGAHCVYKFNANQIKIRAGEWDTQTVKERLPHQERDVAEILYHKDLNPSTVSHDMGLLRLSTPVELSDHINVICLPESGQSFDTSRGCYATGWGKDIFGVAGRFAVIMKKVELNMVANQLCEQQLRKTRVGPRFRLHHTFVCAGGEEGKDLCQGDGGAPLACPLGSDRYTLTGMSAWGIGCGKKDVPGVYVKVAYFRQWIDNAITNWGFTTDGYAV